MNSKSMIQPVILCGGSGSRLWPVSRKYMPKQFLPLHGDQTMLQDTVSLVGNPAMFQNPMIVTNEKFEHIAKRQLHDINVEDGEYILEPEGRNTAPAIAMAAFSACQYGKDSILFVMPSDHVINDTDAFMAMVKLGLRAASDGALVTFGMHAAAPETGYGYICRAGPLPYGSGCYSVGGFFEKPDGDTAQDYIEDGRFYWNSGMFMFSAERYLLELQKFEPELYDNCLLAYKNGSKSNGTQRPDPDDFSNAKNISIDFAIMERTKGAVVVAADIGWSDVGSWDSLATLEQPDGAGNVIEGDAILEDCSNTYVLSKERLVAAIGLDNHIIIDTPDALLIAPKGRSQEVKGIVETLRATDREEADQHRRVHRPWGTFEGIDRGKTHQVKHIVVHPGEKLSLQYHHHRSEHWVVVAGEAEVTLDDDVRRLKVNESIYIPVGAKHRLFNPGSDPVHLIEVQVGDYLGEDDIVRLEDVYGRIVPDDRLAAAE